MNEVHMKDLIEKYKKGLTSAEEEEFLFENSQHPEIQKLGMFLENQKVEVPKDLNEQLWSDFEQKIEAKKTIKIWKWSAVASVTLALAFYGNLRYQNHLNEMKNGQLLEEAISMFPDVEETFQPSKILFEDETIIVYTKTKK